MTLRRAADLAPAPWRNGRGTSRDIVTVSAAGGALLWQASIAELIEDGDFSDYTEFDRVFTPVASSRIALSHDGGPFVPCPVLHPHAFSGEARTRCRIDGEAGRAFNVVTARGQCRAAVEVLHLPSGAAVPQGDVLHCWSGLLDATAGRAGPGDSLLGIPAMAAAASVVILVRVGPAA